MRWSKTFIATLREDPQEAEIESHRLMLRAGMIQKLSAGLYTFLPIGLKVLRKVAAIVRDEMDKAGAIELRMPILQPEQIWEKSGRLNLMGELMMKTEDRNGRRFVLGPTHEEIITDFVSRRIRSYKDLPKNFYQIQTKFRDEIRPRFGLIRAKEFIMKDGYSFSVNEENAKVIYKEMYEAYGRIFSRCGLKTEVVEASTGVMGGNVSHEFMAIADTGEDVIVSSKGGPVANRELAARMPGPNPDVSEKALKKVDTPNLKRVEELADFFKVSTDAFIKTLIYSIGEDQTIGVLVRGDYEINETKLAICLGVSQVSLACDETIERVTGAPVGFAGPVGLKKLRIIADESVRGIKDVITGANQVDTHYQHVSVNRDCEIAEYADLAFAIPGDVCPKTGKELSFKRGIEVGQVFMLGTKYSKSLGATFLDENGKDKPAVMGCYGVGVSRTIAAFVEQNSDEAGITWIPEIAPYEFLVLPINTNEEQVIKVSEEIYESLLSQNKDVLLDDRKESPGVKFKDADLIGFPVQIVIGKRNLIEGLVEVRLRRTRESVKVPLEKAIETALQMCEKAAKISFVK
ncbi:MAG: proline--tRNA ligase [Candidatus Theseobacter exili]|nr:proline--tRNA ligase [Candidatus Theseobacter exili]